MLLIKLENHTLSIPLSEIEFTFSRSSGPGGQNVNKVNSKATLRWNPHLSTGLSDSVKHRFVTQNANKLTLEGELVISSDRFRDRGMNVDDCLKKLKELILRSAVPPKPRKKTKPTKGSKVRKETAKRAQKDRKQNRGKIRF